MLKQRKNKLELDKPRYLRKCGHLVYNYVHCYKHETIPKSKTEYNIDLRRPFG